MNEISIWNGCEPVKSVNTNGDELIRGMALGGRARVLAAVTTALVEELRVRHDTWPTATAALGRAVTAGAMMGGMLKDREKLTIQIKGGGPLGNIVVDANADGDVRGYVHHPHVHLPLNARGKLDVAGAVGTDGHLFVIKDLGLKEPYRGSSPIVSGEIAEDFTHYFAASEQTPSAVALGVLVNPDHSVRAAGGWILQLLPGVEDEEITAIEERLSGMPPVTELIESGQEPEAWLDRLFAGDVRVLSRMPLRFRCVCSRDRVKQTLISLGRGEIEALIREKGEAEVVCHFCNEQYHLNKEELELLLKQM